jgi:predicted TIM-barrel fold metal-dependent hydrolase
VAVLGAGRVVLGTDYPIQRLERPIRVLASADLDEDTREDVGHCNAEAFLH